MTKKPSLSKAKAAAWKAFSFWVRTKDMDSQGFVSCITCGRRNHYKKMQSGHFIPGRHNGVLFDERGVHVQDYSCNVILGGNGPKYYKWMLEHYGQKVIDELEVLDNTTVIYTVEDYQKIEEKYKSLTI